MQNITSNLFPVAAAFMPADAAKICEGARQDVARFGALDTESAPAPTLEELRAARAALAPYARAAAVESVIESREVYDRFSGQSETETFAVVPPVVAQFALICLALDEAKQAAERAPMEAAAPVSVAERMTQALTHLEETRLIMSSFSTTLGNQGETEWESELEALASQASAIRRRLSDKLKEVV